MRVASYTLDEQSPHGRGLVAARPLAPGQLLLRETAWLAVQDHPVPAPDLLDPEADALAAIPQISDRVGVDEMLLRAAARLQLRRRIPAGAQEGAPIATRAELEGLVSPLETYDEAVRERLRAAAAALAPLVKAQADSIEADFARINANGFLLGRPRDPTDRIGLAMAPRAAMVNHSCWPNCVVVNRGRVIEIRALRAVSSGDRLSITYIGLYEGRAERQAELWHKHRFRCACGRCTGETLDVPTLRARRLDEELEAPEAVERRARNTLARMEALYDSEGIHARPRLQEALDGLARVLGRNHPVLFQLRPMLANLAAEADDAHARLDHLTQLARMGDRMLPRHSIEVGRLQVAMADATLRYVEAEALPEAAARALRATALKGLERNLRCFRVCCGADHPATVQAKTLFQAAQA